MADASDDIKLEDDNNDNNDGPKKTRKRVRQEKTWKRNTRKQLRNSGKEYVSSSGKKVTAKAVGKPCSCTQKCYTKVPKEQRENIFDAFYNLSDYNLQNIYLCGRVRRLPVKRRYSVHKEKSRRQFTFKYTVLVKNVEVTICEKAFLSIHAVSHGRVQRALQSSTGIPQQDRRGRHNNRVNKIPDETIEDIKKHIGSFPRYKSLLGKSTKVCREYLHPELNIRKMYHMYTEKCTEEDKKPVKECTYRKIFCESFNLSFGNPKTWDMMQDMALRNQLSKQSQKKPRKTSSNTCAGSTSKAVKQQLPLNPVTDTQENQNNNIRMQQDVDKLIHALHTVNNGPPDMCQSLDRIGMNQHCPSLNHQAPMERHNVNQVQMERHNMNQVPMEQHSMNHAGLQRHNMNQAVVEQHSVKQSVQEVIDVVQQGGLDRQDIERLRQALQRHDANRQSQQQNMNLQRQPMVMDRMRLENHGSVYNFDFQQPVPTNMMNSNIMY